MLASSVDQTAFPKYISSQWLIHKQKKDFTNLLGDCGLLPGGLFLLSHLGVVVRGRLDLDSEGAGGEAAIDGAAPDVPGEVGVEIWEIQLENKVENVTRFFAISVKKLDSSVDRTAFPNVDYHDIIVDSRATHLANLRTALWGTGGWPLQTRPAITNVT